MVLSHGNGFAIDAYYPFWSHFTGHFDVFVHDIRNHGWNPVGDRRAHNLPMFVDDAECIVREIDRRFGKKPRIGVFHSLSSMVALRQASAGGDGFSALVLFDPPVCPPGGFPEDMEGIGRKLCDGPLRRKDRFDTPEAFAERLCEIPVFARMRPGAIDLFARATLRRIPPTEPVTNFAVRANTKRRSFEFIFIWSMTVDLRCRRLSHQGHRSRPDPSWFFHAEHGFTRAHPCRLRFRAGDVSFSPVRSSRRGAPP